MGVRMRHPDLKGQEITVPASAVPFHCNAGWQPIPGQEDAGEEWPAEQQRFAGQEQVRMRHPDLDQQITVAQSAVAAHRSTGWQVIEDQPPEAESAAEAPDGLDGLTVEQLRDLAREQGLPVSGSKAELLQRLRDQHEQASAEVAEDHEEEA